MTIAKRVSTGDVTLGGAIRRESFFLANTFSTRGKKKSDSRITSGFPASMNAYSQLLVSIPCLFCVGRQFWTWHHRVLAGQRLITIPTLLVWV